MRNKNETISKDMRMSDLILNNPLNILILERFEIALGFNDKSIEDICKNTINVEVFLTILNLYNNSPYSTISNFNHEDIQLIIQFLKNSHKYYLLEKYPEISDNIELMIKTNNDPEVIMVKRFFEEYKNEVAEHINYENDISFPYILNLFKAGLDNGNIKELSMYSINDFKKHHDDIEDKLTDLKNLLIKYLPQKKDKKARRKILIDLFELEHDLRIHTEIENKILIPQSERIENIIKNKTRG